MRTYRTRIDRGTAERLLGGAVPGRRSGDPGVRRLAAVLAAAAGAAGAASAGGGAPAAPGAAPRGVDAPRTGGPLPGEAAAVAAFRAARRGSGVGRRRSAVVARALTVKVAVGAAVALAAGGVGVAAGSADLTGPVQERAAATPSASPSVMHSAPRAGSPSPSLLRMCQAYRAELGEKRRREVLDSPGFEVLIAAAGGRDHVASYCDELLGDGTGRDAGPEKGEPGAHPRSPRGRGNPATPRGNGPPTERSD